MRVSLSFPAALAALLAVPFCAPSKGPTLRIVIEGKGLAAPVTIIDEAVIGRFNIGAGPGNFRRLANGTDQPVYIPQGFVVDWSRGAVQPPAGLAANSLPK